jgi:hypothetical protein
LSVLGGSGVCTTFFFAAAMGIAISRAIHAIAIFFISLLLSRAKPNFELLEKRAPLKACFHLAKS